ncbi:peptidoglycan glycosyltransferase PbpC [Desulfosarcina sp. OttesenSCG-928-G10]|nr:peptidoglycan glycosyltransferase PbpC [Desulfosarcina sp. OttesenSCG-928-G10]
MTEPAPPHTGPPKHRRKLLKRFLWCGLALLFLLICGLVLLNHFFPLPLPEKAAARVVLAEDGTPLWRFADENGVWRYPVTAKEVSPLYLEALITYEDRWFYHHPGVNPLSLVRALWQNTTDRRIISGGSTLSMQVARLLDPHPRTVAGKLRQMGRTLQLEWSFSKTEILEFYLNYAPFGGTLEGIGAASWAYLGKPPSRMTPAEAALMAVLPQAPSRLRPDRHPEPAKAARDKVLDRLGRFGVWPMDRIREAREETIWLSPLEEPRLAPLLARRLARQTGAPLIRTTLDAGLQQRLEDLSMGWQSRLPERSSIAILVVEHDTMALRAYIGSVDITNAKRFGHVDMVTAIRSPGSTLKPFLYALALDDGLIHSESLLQDVPRRYGDYRPGNFSEGFNGPVSAAEALVSSLNLPAVHLMEVYGPKRFVGELRHAGMGLFLSGEPSLSVILGGVGVRLEDLVAGYSVFARNGKLARIRMRPEDPVQERRLMSPGAAWIVRRILMGQTRPDRHPRAELVQRRQLAWKTGTSYGLRDAWAIGVGPRHIVGVWVGRPDGTPVPGQYGRASATPLLLQVHDILVNQDQRQGSFPVEGPRPPEVGVAQICWPSGQVLDPEDTNCRNVRFAWTLDGLVPPTLLAGDHPLGLGLSRRIRVNEKGLAVGPSCEGATERDVILWPPPLEPWLPASEWQSSRLPKPDPDCPPAGFFRSVPLAIVGITDTEVLRPIQKDEKVLTLTVSALGGTGTRWWFLNGEPAGTTTGTDELRLFLEKQGDYRLGVIDEAGFTATVGFKLIP